MDILKRRAAPRCCASCKPRTARGDRTIIVVTGAGRAGQGVLKQRLPDWLAELRPLIAGYAQAHRQHGGAGAFYVFLKRKS